MADEKNSNQNAGDGAGKSTESKPQNIETVQTTSTSTEDVLLLKKENEKLIKELSKLRKDNEDKEVNAKKEKEDFKGLYEGEKGKSTQLEIRLRLQGLKLVALQHGFQDPEDILRFEKQFTFDAEGNVTNASEIIADVKKNKSYLFKTIESGNVNDVPKTDAGKPNTGSPGQKVFTREDIKKMSPKEFSENEEAIKTQMKAGLIK